jgi:PIN domain nuclease of toxin-antitoxin system
LEPRFLLDTHILVRWLMEPGKLSRAQRRAIENAERGGEPVAFSAVSLLEIALLASEIKPRLNIRLGEFFETLQANPFFELLPLTYEIAAEVAALGGSLRDPVDRAIVATARVHRLRLVTSDQRIAASKLASVVE